MTCLEDYPRSPAGVATRPAIYAHRGSSLLRPENTAIAFDWALEAGADVLETDVRLSRDDQVMVVHDRTLERTTDGCGAVRDHAASALERLDAGHRFDGPDGRHWRDRGARIMTLAAMFQRYPTTRINIDIKDRDPRAADRVAAVIADTGREQAVTVGSFHAGVLKRFRRIAPDVATAAGQAEVAALYFGRGIGRGGRARYGGGSADRTGAGAARGASLPYRYLQIPVRHAGLPLATRAFIETARAHEVQSVYWTVNDEATMRRLIDRNVAGIVTDRADVLARVLSVSGVPAT